MVDWIWTNKEWLFSGFGATAVAALGAVFKYVASRQEKRRRIERAKLRADLEANRNVRRAAQLFNDHRLLDDLTPVARSGGKSNVRVCDFCRKSEQSVLQLFTKNGAVICNECLDGGIAAFDRGQIDPEAVKELANVTFELSKQNLTGQDRYRLETQMTALVARTRKRRRDAPGDIVAGVELVRPLGAGNFATVWEAKSQRPGNYSNRTVAVKIFDQDKIALGLMLWRFQRGIRAMRMFADLGKKTPKSIVKLFEISADQLSFSMEYLPGGDLQQLAKRGFSTKKKLELFSQVAEAVSFAHRNGIIHRDIKPANIVLNADGEAVLTDFDIADLTFASTQSVYAGGLGTPLFAAPEQLACAGEAAQNTCDIFSMGKLLYFLLTEKAPPIGSTEAAHMPGYLKAISFSAIRNGIWIALRERPEERQQSMEALMQSLCVSYPTR